MKFIKMRGRIEGELGGRGVEWKLQKTRKDWRCDGTWLGGSRVINIVANTV